MPRHTNHFFLRKIGRIFFVVSLPGKFSERIIIRRFGRRTKLSERILGCIFRRTLTVRISVGRLIIRRLIIRISIRRLTVRRITAILCRLHTANLFGTRRHKFFVIHRLAIAIRKNQKRRKQRYCAKRYIQPF